MKSWLTLVTSLPTENATVRQRVWRALKASGAAVLRDGVYLLPLQASCRATLQAIADEVRHGNGRAWVMQLKEPEQESFQPLFDRSADYAAILKVGTDLLSRLTVKNATNTLKQARKLRKSFALLADIDFFAGAARQQTETALLELEARCNRILVPDEPHATKGRIPLLLCKDYQNKLWATRQRPWVDRLASAWLIKRFIDPAARFKWLKLPAECPKNALGFDFDGAKFTHVDNRVTFEVLMASFALQQPALRRLAALVHYLDVGGVQPVEAAGLESILRGMREQIKDDSALLISCLSVFDGLYASFSNDGKGSGK